MLGRLKCCAVAMEPVGEGERGQPRRRTAAQVYVAAMSGECIVRSVNSAAALKSCSCGKIQAAATCIDPHLLHAEHFLFLCASSRSLERSNVVLLNYSPRFQIGSGDQTNISGAHKNALGLPNSGTRLWVGVMMGQITSWVCATTPGAQPPHVHHMGHTCDTHALGLAHVAPQQPPNIVADIFMLVARPPVRRPPPPQI